MERGDLLKVNGGIFAPQGKAINDHAASDVRVLVVGNPCNTNCLIARSQRARHPGRPLVRHDPPRREPGQGAAGQEGRRAGQGRHQRRDLGQPLRHPVPRLRPRQDRWQARGRGHQATTTGSKGEFITTVQKRGAAVIEARGSVSAASAANAVIDSVNSIWHEDAQGRLALARGLQQRRVRHARGPAVRLPGGRATARVGRSSRASSTTRFAKSRIKITTDELLSERDEVRSLGLIPS